MTSSQTVDARSLIEADYARYGAAFCNKDIDAIMALFTSDFKWNLLDGTSMDLSNTRSAIEQDMDTTISVSEMSIAIESFAVSGDRAVVHTTEHMVATRRSNDGHPECLTIDETYRDVWIKTTQGWKFQLAEVLTSESITN